MDQSKILHTIEIIFILISIFAIMANTLIIYTILHHEKAGTVPNVYVANWAFVDIFCIIVIPSAYEIASTTNLKQLLSHNYSTWLSQFGVTLHSTAIISVMLLAVDWFFAAYFRRISEKLRPWHKYILGVFWLFGIIVDLLTFACGGKHHGCIINEVHLLLFSFTALSTFVFINICFRGIQKCRGRQLEYPMLHFNLVVLFVGIWTVGFANLMDVRSLFRVDSVEIRIFLLRCCMVASSILNFIILYRQDENFKACFRQTIRLSDDGQEESLYHHFEDPLVIEDVPIEEAIRESTV